MATENLAAVYNSGVWSVVGASATVAVATPDDENTTNVNHQTVGENILYDIANPAVITGSDTINSVTIRLRGRIDPGVGFSMGVQASVDNFATNKAFTPAITTSYANHDMVMALQPDDATAWDLTALNALQVKALATDDDRFYITTLYVIVDYTAGGGGGGSVHAVPLTGAGLL